MWLGGDEFFQPREAPAPTGNAFDAQHATRAREAVSANEIHTHVRNRMKCFEQYTNVPVSALALADYVHTELLGKGDGDKFRSLFEGMTMVCPPCPASFGAWNHSVVGQKLLLPRCERRGSTDDISLCRSPRALPREMQTLAE